MTTDPVAEPTIEVTMTLKQLQVADASLCAAADLTEKVAGRYTHAFQLLAGAQRAVSAASDELAMHSRHGIPDKPGKPGVPETITGVPHLLEQPSD